MRYVIRFTSGRTGLIMATYAYMKAFKVVSYLLHVVPIRMLLTRRGMWHNPSNTLY